MKKTLATLLLLLMLVAIPATVAAQTIEFYPPVKNTTTQTTFNFTVYTTSLLNTSFIVANITYPRQDLIVSNCYKNNTNINGISFSLTNLSTTVSSVQINATNTSQLFTSPGTRAALFDIQYRFYNTVPANDTVTIDSGTTQWYGNASTIDTGFHAFSTVNNGYVNASLLTNFTQQDIWLAPAYTLTLHVTASDTGQPIPSVSLVDSLTQSYTTSNGTFVLSYPYSAVQVYVSATGYASKSASYVMDQDRTETIQLTPATENQKTTFYVPQQVRIRLYDQNLQPLNHVYITSTPLNFTAPADWTNVLFGIDNSVNMNGTTLTGFTGSDGSWAAPMLASFEYQFRFIDASRSIDVNMTFYPSQTEYVFQIPVGFVKMPDLINTVSFSLGNASINSTAEYVNMTYADTSGGTTYLNFTVTNQSGYIVSSELYPAGAASATYSQVIIHGSGQEYTYGFSAVQSSYGWINNSGTMSFATTVALFGQSPGWIEYWLSVGIIIILAAAFSVFSIRFAMLIIPLISWFLQYVTGWFDIGIGGALMFGGVFVLGVLKYIRDSENKI